MIEPTVKREPAFAPTANAGNPRPHPAPICHPEIPKPISGRDQAMLSISCVAERFGRSSRTVRWWIATGRLPVVRIGRTPFVPIEALNRMVAEIIND